MAETGETQEDITRAVLAAVQEFLGGPEPAGDEWTFAFGEHLASPWGGVYGGALAAASVSLARAAMPERSPRSLHIQFVRNLPCASARAVAAVRNAGRTVATVQVDLFDVRDKLATTALVTLVAPDAVLAQHHVTDAEVFQITRAPMMSEQARLNDSGIVATLQSLDPDGMQVDNARPSVTGQPTGALHAVVPWDDLRHTGPEVACLVADMANGLAVAAAFADDEDIVFPNTDLSLRFTTAPATKDVLASSTLVSMPHGTTTTAIEVQAGDQHLAQGLSSGVLVAIPTT